LEQNKDVSFNLALERQEFSNKQKDYIFQLESKLQEKEKSLRCLQEDNKNFDTLHKQLKEALNKEKFKSASLEKILKENKIYFVKNEVFFSLKKTKYKFNENLLNFFFK
jgi:hypothetical protein